MARTQSQDFGDKRAAIMKQAAQLFAVKGFNGASISDLSKACGVSKSLIYHYYAAKEDILFDVMNNHIEDLLTVIVKTHAISTDPKDNFTHLTKAILTCYAGAEDEQKVLLYELANLKPEQRQSIVKKQRAIISKFESLYSDIFPELKSDLPLLRSKIMLFFGMLNWTHTWFNPSGTISRDRLAELAADIII